MPWDGITLLDRVRCRGYEKRRLGQAGSLGTECRVSVSSICPMKSAKVMATLFGIGGWMTQTELQPQSSRAGITTYCGASPPFSFGATGVEWKPFLSAASERESASGAYSCSCFLGVIKNTL